MNLDIYDVTYLITNAFGTYIIYKFMAIFFDRGHVNKRMEFLSYSIYFVIISLIYLTIGNPIVNLITNLILFILLTLNYPSRIKNRVFAIIIIYVMLLCIEVIVGLKLMYFYGATFSMNTRYTSIIGMIVVKMVSYVIILFMGNYSNIKKGVNISNTYWLSMFFIPSGSLYIIIILFTEFNGTSYNIIFSISILFAINIVTFYLYDVLTKLFEDKMEKIIFKEQNKYYQNQIEIMETNNKDSRAFNHDLRNHLAIVRGYIQMDESEKACKHIDIMTESDYTIKEISKSGNIDIDNILNYKLYEASKENINVSLEIKVPISINISSYDIVVILGNLLDNGIEAASKVKDNKKIDIIIIYEKEILFISINNTFDGNIIYEKDSIITSKMDKKNHGIGLNNIKKIVRKYDGVIDMDYSGNEFCVDITLYIK